MQIAIHQWSTLDALTRSRLLSRAQAGIDALSEKTGAVVEKVRASGDEALLDYTKRFDGVDLAEIGLRVTPEEFETARKTLPAKIRDAIDFAVRNVTAVHERQRPPDFAMDEVSPGIRSGERFIAIGTVGLYVPRGRGSFPSMLYMLAIPARIAGVPRIAIATPPGTDGTVDPACLYAAQVCGVDEIYRVGGAQAVAAFAFGTQTVPRVDKIVGPGSAYVAAAKRAVRDVVDVGLPAGPSESMIVADACADAATVARDLLVEAEHGADSQAILVTTDSALAAEVASRLPGLIGGTPEPRRGFLEASFGELGAVLLASNRNEAASIVNEFAPEHLQLRLERPRDFARAVRNAGESLIGRYTPFSLANYAIGANAVLPTGGGARVHSGVSVTDFLKRVAVMEVTEEGYDDVAHHVRNLAEYEGFYWHAHTLDGRGSSGAGGT